MDYNETTTIKESAEKRREIPFISSFIQARFLLFLLNYKEERLNLIKVFTMAGSLLISFDIRGAAFSFSICSQQRQRNKVACLLIKIHKGIFNI
jgi:hypothetical protein